MKLIPETGYHFIAGNSVPSGTAHHPGTQAVGRGWRKARILQDHRNNGEDQAEEKAHWGLSQAFRACKLSLWKLGPSGTIPVLLPLAIFLFFSQNCFKRGWGELNHRNVSTKEDRIV